MRRVWQPQEWRRLTDAHIERVRPWVQPRLDRRAVGERHPVEDFLWEYYRFRPGQLLQWHPGWREGAADHEGLRGDREYDTVAGISSVRPVLPRRRRDRVLSAIEILRATADRPASFGCFGMHEWAMVYRLEQSQVRHSSVPLRLSPRTIAEVVDDVGLRCSHFDAYRFFTPQAAVRQAPLTRAGQAAAEQSGCVHAGMDLYRYAYEAWPHVGSLIVADCHAFAREARRIDMAASPYDLTGWGVEPIAVEEAAGRRQYAAQQRELSGRAEPLRRRLLAELAALTLWASPG
jgi:hypothetical protein